MSQASEEALRRAVAALAAGGIVAHPTETVYGLGVDPFNPQALERLARLKGARVGKGFICLVAGVAQVSRLAREPLPPLARELMARCWPGPLTLVVAAREGLHPLLTGGGGEVAIRWSPHPLMAALLRLWGAPLVSTSANPAGQPPLADGAAVRALWGERVAMVLEARRGLPDGSGGLPSTVLRVDGAGARLLREGAFSLVALRRVIPDRDFQDCAGNPLR